MYPAIAHNAITVTDVRDTVTAPGKEGKPRPIANERGQRRYYVVGPTEPPPSPHGWLEPLKRARGA